MTDNIDKLAGFHGGGVEPTYTRIDHEGGVGSIKKSLNEARRDRCWSFASCYERAYARGAVDRLPALRLEIDRNEQVVMKIGNVMRDRAPRMTDDFELTRDEGHEALLPEVLLSKTVLPSMDTCYIPYWLNVNRLTLRDGIPISSRVTGLIRCQFQCSRSGCRAAAHFAIRWWRTHPVARRAWAVFAP